MEIVKKDDIDEIIKSTKSTHDWVIERVEEILRARKWPGTWKIIEKNLSYKPGFDLKTQTPNGEYVILESEVEHASSKNEWKEKVNKIKRGNFKVIIVVGEKKHGEKLQKELGNSYKVFSWPVWKLAEGLLPI